MKKNEIEDKIIKFWSWFSNNESLLFPDKITDKLIDELNGMILSMGDFDWEIREGETKDNMLVVSPGGDLDLLKITKRIVELSPQLKNWEFQYYKPAKDWNYQFSLDVTDAKKMVDASDWEYVLLKFPDGTYDIIIKATTLKALPEDDRIASVNIALDSILGEKLRLQLIQDVDLVNEFPKEYIDKSSSIKSLKNQMFELEGIR